MEMEDLNTNDQKLKRKFSFGLVGVLLLAAGGLFAGLLISFVTVVAVKETSGAAFCSSCHSMKPMAKAYANDIHGGYGKSGVMAKCADCHLPHDSTIGYLAQKIKTGVWDVWVESTHDTKNIDWHEKRDERREWVYDSGCLHCHENLLRGTRPNKKAFTAHKAYFAKKLVVQSEHGRDLARCVDCHKHVGHNRLEDYLPVVQDMQAVDAKQH